MKDPVSGEIAELHCANNEVEDTCLSPPLLCSLVGSHQVCEAYEDQSAQYEAVR